MRHLVWTAVAAALLATGCRSQRVWKAPRNDVLDVGCKVGSGPFDLDRGDWMVSSDAQIWKVFEERYDGRKRQLGFLVARDYRQLRGGPSHRVYTVTGTKRRDERGRIDAMGRAWRYQARRNQPFEEIDLGANGLENNVGAIFQSEGRVELVQTSARMLAFESLDVDGSGLLEAGELAGKGDRIAAADTNHDGVVDFQEFDAIDVL